jgi:chain length determinant protein EpsF
MTFTFLLSALRARYRLFLMILGTTLFAAILVSLLVPKTYVAKVSLLMDGRDEQSLRVGNQTPDRERLGYLQTQVDILTSPRVAHRVIRDLHLADDSVIREDYKNSSTTASFEDWLGDSLLKRLKVDSTQSSVVHVTYSTDNPVFAARIANGFARAYVDTVLDLRVAPIKQTSAWFGEQLKSLRESMEQADQRLIEFQKRNGIYSSDERYDVDQLHMADLASRAARVGTGASQSAASTGSDGGARLSALRSELLRAETKLQELSAELGSRHPQYKRKQAELDAMRAELERTAQRESQINRQRQTVLAGAMTAQGQRLLERKQARSQLAMLTSEAVTAQRTYDAAMQRFMNSKVEAGAVNTNVSVMNLATPPAAPARPNIVLNAALALVIGALLALTAVYLLESADRRVRLIEDLDGNPNMPLLAVLNAFDPARDAALLAPFNRKALPGPG